MSIDCDSIYMCVCDILTTLQKEVPFVSPFFFLITLPLSLSLSLTRNPNTVPPKPGWLKRVQIPSPSTPTKQSNLCLFLSATCIKFMIRGLFCSFSSLRIDISFCSKDKVKASQASAVLFADQRRGYLLKAFSSTTRNICISLFPFPLLLPRTLFSSE